MSPDPTSFTVDFHVHTFASRDSLTTPGELIQAAHDHGLDRVVVTDHNTIRGALAAQALDPGLIIVGEEIKTTQGEILAVYVREEVPANLTPQETVQRLRLQGAFISISHPFDSWRNGAWHPADLLALLPMIDAIEIFNSRCLFPGDNRKARDFATRHTLPGTAGSDAHTLSELGTACLVIPPFNTAEELRRVIPRGRVKGRLSPFWVHFSSHRARMVKENHPR